MPDDPDPVDDAPAGPPAGDQPPGDEVAPRRDPGSRGGAPGHRSYGLDAGEEDNLRRGAPEPPSQRGRRVAFRFLAVLLVVVVLVGGLLAYVRLSTRDHRYGAGSVPATRIGIVFGAGLRAGGRPSPMLDDRLQLAADLYRGKLVSHLLFTGDHGTTSHDEVNVMRDRAVELGVPEDAITLDHAGFDTYDSCYRARTVFGVEQAIVITQRFHLPRAVYTCRQLGIDASGVGAADWSRYASDMPRHEVREVLSTVKALWELHVTRPKPTFLGPDESIG